MSELHTILVPIDLTAVDHRAYELSCSLARQYDARLLVLFVDEERGNFSRTANLVWGDDSLRPLEPPRGQASLCAKLREVLPPVADVRTEYLSRVGIPSGEIIACAQQEQVDLVVIGSHGKGMFSQMLGGSVAQEVIRRSPCSVFLMRPSLHGNEPGTKAADASHEPLSAD